MISGDYSVKQTKNDAPAGVEIEIEPLTQKICGNVLTKFKRCIWFTLGMKNLPKQEGAAG